MAFTVEDGSGLAAANAYIDVAFFDAYFTDRGNTVAVALTQPQKEVAIVKATDYVDIRFGKRFLGAKAVVGQALQWPRFYVDGIDSDEIPTALKKAVAEYALRAHSSALAPDPLIEDSGRTPISTVEKIGPVWEENKFAESDKPMTFRPYPAADMLLSELITSGSTVVR